MWDLSKTYVPCTGRWVPINRTTKEVTVLKLSENLNSVKGRCQHSSYQRSVSRRSPETRLGEHRDNSLIGSEGKESACNAGDLGSIPALGRSPGGGHGSPLQHSCLENPHGQGSLVVYSPWGWKELDTTKRLSTISPAPHP